MSAFFPWLDWPTSLAPTNLTQPINSGWSFLTVNEGNSSAPDTERRIIAQDSYGRQIGKLMDVVELLVAEAEKTNDDLAKAECVEKFTELKKRIDKAKDEAREARQKRLIEDLMDLKRKDETEFTAVIKAVTT